MPDSDHRWPNRVERVLSVLTDQWQTFDVVGANSALDAKQLTGALVWLRNRGRVESRRTCDDPVMLWRLP